MVTKGVEERTKGTKEEVEGQAQVAPSAEPRTPEDASKVSPKEEKPIYTQKQADALLKAQEHALRSDIGRDLKTLTTERDNFKSEKGKLESALADIQTERDKIQTDLEEATSDDPKKFDLVTRDKQLRDTQRQLKTDADALKADQEANAEKVKLATDTLFEISVWEIAAEYQSGDPVKLKDLCTTFTATSEEQIRKVADTIWQKVNAKSAPAGEKAVPLKLVDGETTGGGGETDEERSRKRYSKRFPPK